MGVLFTFSMYGMVNVYVYGAHNYYFFLSCIMPMDVYAPL
jgi:hypothetical protein